MHVQHYNKAGVRYLGLVMQIIIEQTCSQKFVRGSSEENVDLILLGSGAAEECALPTFMRAFNIQFHT